MKIRILLIDDDRSSREGISSQLKLAEILVSAFSNGQEALDQLEKDPRGYTAVLLDYVLNPGAALSGEELLREILKKHPRLPVIIFTGLDPVGGIETLGQGAFAYMQRPLDYVELVHIIQELAEQNNILADMAKNIRDVMQADDCLVWQLDKKGNFLHVTAWSGNVDEGYSNSIILNANDKTLFKFLVKGEPLYLSDVTDNKISPTYLYREEAIAHNWKSLISLPLVYKSNIIGLIDCYSYTPESFGKLRDHVRVRSMLRAFITHGAQAIHFADILRRTRVLQEIDQTLASTLNLDTILRQILYKVLDLVGTDWGWLCLVNPATGVLKLEEAMGIPENYIDIQNDVIGVSIGKVIKNGAVSYISDLSSAEEEISARYLNVGSAVLVPLRRGSQTIGILITKSQHINHFDDDDIDLLFTLAAQATIAIGRAKLTQHLQEVSRLALIESNFLEIAEYVVTATRDLTGADVNLWMMSELPDERERFMRIVTSRGNVSQNFKENARLPATPGSSINAQSLDEKRPIIKDDIFNQSEEPKFVYLKDASNMNWVSFMVVPLLGRDGERLGALSLYGSKRAQFSFPEAELIQTFANQAAIALQQQKRALNLKKLVDIGQILSENITGTPQHFSEQIVIGARSLLGADCAVLYPYDPIKKQFYDKESISAVGLNHSITEVTNKPGRLGLSNLIRKEGILILHDLDKGEFFLSNNHKNTTSLEDEKIINDIRSTKFVRREGIRAFVGISLKSSANDFENSDYKNSEAGILYIDFRIPHHFTLDELQIISVFAHQVASLMRGARLYTNVERQAKELDAVHKTALKIIAKENLPSLLEALAENATRLLKGTGGKVYLRVPNQEKIQLVAAYNLNSEAFPIGSTLNFNEGLVGKVFQSKKLKIINNYQEWKGRIEKLAPLIKNLIEVPLSLGNETIGVLSVFDNTGMRKFSRDDFPILDRLAQQAALAIHNTDLVEKERKLRKQADTLRDISAAISADWDIEIVAGKILDEIKKVIKYNKATIQLIVREDQRDLIAYRGFTSMEINKSLLGPISQDRLMSRIIKRRKAEILSNSTDDPDWEIRPETMDVKSWVCIPLMFGEKALGILTLDNDHAGYYDETFRDLLVLFGNQAAIALQNAILYKNAKTQIRQLEAINKSAQTISTKLGTNVLLRTIVMQIWDQLKCTHCAIFLPKIKEGKINLVSRTTIGKYADEIKSRYFGIGEGIAGWVYENGEAVNLGDVKLDIRFSPAKNQKYEPSSLLVVPIKIDNRTIGVISADQDQKNWFTENDQFLVETLAQHAGIAIEKGRLYDQLQELDSAGLKVNSNLDLDQVLRSIAESIRHLLRADIATIFPYQSDKGEFEDGVRQGKGNKKILRPTNLGMAAQVVKNKKPVFKVKKYLNHGLPIKIDKKRVYSYAAIPLVVGGMCVGLMFIDFFEEHVFSIEEKRLAILFGNHAANAISNARNFENTKLKRWAELGQLAGSVAHRIGNKGGSIRLKVEELRLKTSEIEKLIPREINAKPLIDASMSALDFISQNNQYTLELSDLLFKPFRASEEPMSETSIGLILNSAIRNSGLSEDIIIKTEYSSSTLPMVKANHFFTEVFLEIITNGAEAMRDSPTRVLTISASSVEKWVYIFFSDTGIGIAPEDQEKIFDLFSSRDRKKESNHFGFGLWWVRMFLRDVGGDIEVKSEEGYGATFTIKLPVEESNET